ncbi:MAG: hypothetical protein LC799_28015 [Actinobacteria bacterium]|nr:hypothetical protein [Actinomycetota bacterium]
MDLLATLLAQAVDGQWRTEAHERLLLPDPIPLHWSLSDLTVAGRQPPRSAHRRRRRRSRRCPPPGKG